MEKSLWFIKDSHLPQSLKQTNYDKDILSILAGRGISTTEEVEIFLNPSLKNLSSPFDFSDIDSASSRIISAITKKEKIYIYGDYDVDGITSVSLLHLGLKRAGGNVEFYIPMRDEGYGLNKDAIFKLKQDDCSLLITVDCGISSHSEIEYANSLGITVIVTDHHEITNGLPSAFAVINPKREDNISKFRYLAGVGTAFMLLSAVFIKSGIPDEVYNYLDIVAIGTVADIVSLTGDNRILVYFGLKQLNTTKNIGLSSLIKSFFGNNHPLLGTSEIGFKIAPAFNAAGRLEYAGKGVMLLTTESEKEADLIAEELKIQNDERKEIQKEIFEKAEEKIASENLSLENSIIVADSSFHHGVIGIVASKIVDKYYKPAIIMEIKDDGFAVASARSIEGFNLIKALDSMKELFIKYGGHEGAAGFSIPVENIDNFKIRFNNYISENVSQEIYNKPVKIEKEITPAKISYEFFSVLSRLEPFGFGNPKPLFCIKNVSLSNVRVIGEDRTHVMFDIIKNGYVIRNCAWFGKSHHYDTLASSQLFNAAFKLESSEFKEKVYIKPFIEDVKLSCENSFPLKEYSDLYNFSFPLVTLCYGNTLCDLEKNVSLNFDTTGNIQVLQNKKIISFLSSELSKLLKDLSLFYRFKFKTKLLKIESKENLFHIYIEISKENSFNTLSTKDSSIFNDIKEFLIGSFDYNTMQKKVLSAFFKENKNIILKSEFGRGIKTSILTIAIYIKITTGKNSLLVSKDFEVFSELLNEYFDIFSEEPESISNYDFAVFIDTVPLNYKGRAIIISSSDLNNFKDFLFIKDDFSIPENITIIAEEDILSKNSSEFFTYSKYLPVKDKLAFKNSFSKYNKVISDNSILALI